MSPANDHEHGAHEDRSGDAGRPPVGQRGLGGGPVADALLSLQRSSGNANVNRILARGFWDALREGSKKVEDTLSDLRLASERKTERARQVVEGATSSKDRHGASVTVPHVEPLRGEGPNRSYQKARDRVDTWFDDALLVTNALLDAKEEGLVFFGEYSGAEYNEAGTSFLDFVLEIASVLPLVGAGGRLLTKLAGEAQLAQAIGRIEKVAGVANEGIGKARSTHDSVEVLGGGIDSEPEGVGRVEFKADVKTSLRHERIRIAGNLQRLRDVVFARLEALEYSVTLDLVAIAKTYLDAAVGRVPKLDDRFKREADQLAAGFELELYERYYGRRAYWLHSGPDGKPPVKVELKGVPRRLPDRLRALCTQLGKPRDLRKALKDWNLPHRRLDQQSREVEYPAHERTLHSFEAVPVYGDIVAGVRKAIEERF